MDIERLKEAKDYIDKCLYHATNKEPWENSYKNVESHKTVVTIIDEAIARQSVKSEEVAEAISWLTSTGHSNQYMSGNWTAPMKNHINRAIQETILAALQEYQPAKTETTSCEWCEKIGKYAGFAYATFFEQTAPDEQYEISVECNYCPNCGKALKGGEDA